RPKHDASADAPGDGLVLARPVARDQADLSRIGLVEGGVVEDEQPAGEVDLGALLVPEGVGVGLEAGSSINPELGLSFDWEPPGHRRRAGRSIPIIGTGTWPTPSGSAPRPATSSWSAETQAAGVQPGSTTRAATPCDKSAAVAAPTSPWIHQLRSSHRDRF